MQFLSSTFLSDSPIMISRSHSCIASHIWDAFKNLQNRQNVHFLTKTFSNILYKYYKVLNFQICNNFEKSCSNGLIFIIFMHLMSTVYLMSRHLFLFFTFRSTSADG